MLGDVYLLCAQEIFEERTLQPQVVPYLRCLLSSETGMADAGYNCLRQDFEADIKVALYQCVRSAKIAVRLEESFRKTSAADVTASPTIYMNGEPYCKSRESAAMTEAVSTLAKGGVLEEMTAVTAMDFPAWKVAAAELEGPEGSLHSSSWLSFAAHPSSFAHLLLSRIGYATDEPGDAPDGGRQAASGETGTSEHANRDYRKTASDDIFSQ